MSQFNAPVRRSGGDIDVYTGILCAAFLVLVVGVVLMALRNVEHSRLDTQAGGVVTLVK
ncbi:MAG: hypothetical protein ACYS0D_10810 [Planctomycetota bacterium]|jgi:uncharacterized membrane protein